MNFLQKATLSGIGGLDFRVKKVGNQVSLAEPYRDGLPVLQPYSIVRALEADVKRNPFLYSALRKKADAIAGVPFYVEEYRDGQWVRVPNHPAEHLIEGANPFMSGFELKKQMVYHKDLSGSAFMQIVKVNGMPQFLQPLFPQWVKVVPSVTNFVDGFEYAIGGAPTVMLAADEVFWTKHADPSDPYRGLSPLSAITGEIQTDLEARRWNMISLANRGSSDVAFIMRSVVTEEDYQFARRMIEDRIAGPDNARRPWVLGGDADVRPLSYTAVEMDYINTRKFNREVISAALGVPAPLIGDADNSTYNNLDTLKRDFWQDTITNFLEELRQDLTRQVLLPYYGDGRRTKLPYLRYMYDLSNVEALQANMLEKAQIAKTMRDAGFTLRQVNQYLEYDFEIVDEPEATPVADSSEDARVILQEMALNALRVKDNPVGFARAIEAIHEAYCKSKGVKPNYDSARARAEAYLNSKLPDDALALHIADGEGNA